MIVKVKKANFFLFKWKTWWENKGNFFPTPYAITANLIGHIGFVNCQIIASASISRKKTSFAVIIFGKYLEVINMYSRLKSNSKFEIFRCGWKKPPHPAWRDFLVKVKEDHLPLGRGL